MDRIIKAWDGQGGVYIGLDQVIGTKQGPRRIKALVHLTQEQALSCGFLMKTEDIEKAKEYQQKEAEKAARFTKLLGYSLGEDNG